MFRPPSGPVVAFLALLLLAFLALPWLGGPYAVKLATRMLVIAIFVLSLDLLIGVTGLVSFGHAAFFGLGAYAVYFVSPEDEAANALVALASGAGLAAAAALVVGAFAVLTRGFYFIMVTLAAGQMIFSVFHDTVIAKGSDGAYINVDPVLSFAGRNLIDFSERAPFYYFVLAVLVLTYIAFILLVRSPFGRVLQAVRVNETRCRALGYDTYLFKLTAFTIAGAIAGVAGALFASIDGFVTPELMSWRESGLAIMMAVLGGVGTLYGPMVGAVVYISFEDLLKTESLVGALVAAHWRFGTGLALILAVLLSPRGLTGVLANWTQRSADDSFQDELANQADGRDEHTRGGPSTGKALAATGLTKRFGGVVAVDDVSVQFAPNRVHAVIGPNGAGKTTFGNLLSSALSPSAGRVTLDDLDVTGAPVHKLARRGLGRSFQRTSIFPALTVAENCAFAAQARTPQLTRWRDAPFRAVETRAVARALAVTGLLDRARAVAGTLSNGEQRQLEIAMLVARGAKLLLLDEPLAGMGPEETKRVVALLRELAADHTIILIEHDMDAVFAVADTITVLVEGRLIAHDAPDAIRRNAAVRKAYLGGEAQAEAGA
jgi:branched-chain amino acid transport system permease protein